MRPKDALLPEYDHEMRSTRSLIALVTDDLAAWRPHARARTSGELALHLANLPRWVKITLEETFFDLNPKDGNRPPSPVYESQSATLAFFDENTAAGRAVIEATPDENMMSGWSLMNGGETVFTLPRVAVLRSFVMNHMIHHRGQLSVYLRMQGMVLPEIYGPNADTEGR